MEKPLLEKMAATLKEFYGDNPKDTRDYSRIINERHTERVAALIEGKCRSLASFTALRL
jgi:hypothetical protein